MRFVKGLVLCAPLLGLVAIVMGLPAVAFGEPDRNEFTARLIGFNEVPSINTDGSATVTLKLSASKIEFELKYQNLSGPPAVAHIHFGQARTNGSPMVFFCGGGGQPACPTTASGTVTGSITAANVVGPAAQGINPGDLAAVERAIRGGAAYANMHSAKFGSGEIRGQLHRGDAD
jgi:hypothetical protein